MNKQNSILITDDVLDTYKSQIPIKQRSMLESRQWVPLTKESILAQKSAYLVGKVMGDGNLDESFTCRFVGQLEDLTILKELITRYYSVEERRMTIRPKKARGYSNMLQINDSLFGRFLYALGAPFGNKAKKQFIIPSWITTSKTHQIYFLRAIFDDELSTIKLRKARIREAAFRMAKVERYQNNLYEFLSQIKKLTENFSVKCSNIERPRFENVHKDGNKTFSLCFRILGNKKNVIKFSENIGFELNQTKIRELERCVCYIKMREAGFEPANALSEQVSYN